MSNKKATGSPLTIPCFKKGMKANAVMPPQSLTTAPSAITLQNVDGATPPNPVTIGPGDSVTGTLASDSTSFVVAAGADSLHYTATIPAQTPLGTVVNLSATETGTIQGSPANFTSSIQLTLNIPPVAVAVDLQIIIA